MAAKRGRFVTGRFDERGRPLSAIVAAVERLVDFALAGDAEQLTRLRDRLLSKNVLGDLAADAIRAIPCVQLITGACLSAPASASLTLLSLSRHLGPQPSSPALPVAESADSRFFVLLVRLLRAFTSGEQPLVLFLDDLHHCDPPSLRLLELLAADREAQHLLVICAARPVDSGVVLLVPRVSVWLNTLTSCRSGRDLGDDGAGARRWPTRH